MDWVIYYLNRLKDRTMKNKQKMELRVAHNMILIDYIFRACSFVNFVSYCKANKYEREDFDNWPFDLNLDGSKAYPKTKL